jgi:hypothetical protein
VTGYVPPCSPLPRRRHNDLTDGPTTTYGEIQHDTNAAGRPTSLAIMRDAINSTTCGWCPTPVVTDECRSPLAFGVAPRVT